MALAITMSVMLHRLRASSATPSYTGIGVWGNNSPVFWAFDIINFVFWVGIGHAGTLISRHPVPVPQALAQRHRPLRRGHDHLRRDVRGHLPPDPRRAGPGWPSGSSPTPTSAAIWPNFRSPLLWDVFAVSTYFSVSAMFWYLGLIPDLASMRDRTHEQVPQADLHRSLSLGWRGAASPLAALREGLPAPGGPGHGPGAVGPQRGVLRLRRPPWCPAGT